MYPFNHAGTHAKGEEEMSRASFHILSFYSLGKLYYVLIIDVDGSFVRIVITLSQTSIKYLQRIKLCLNQKKIQPYIITHTWHTLWQETYLLMKGCVLSKMCNSSTIYSNNIIHPAGLIVYIRVHHIMVWSSTTTVQCILTICTINYFIHLSH